MTEAQAALTGALIGALAGLAGGAFAAISSIKASQVSARAPLADLLHGLTNNLVSAYAALGSPEADQAVTLFELQWNRFAMHQRILCPSVRIEALSSIVRSELEREDLSEEAKIHLAGQILEKVARMVGAHSTHLTRWRARLSERKILREWLSAEQSQLLGPEARTKLEAM